MRTDRLCKTIRVAAVAALLVPAAFGCASGADTMDPGATTTSAGTAVSTTLTGSGGRVVYEADSSAMLKDYYMTIDELSTAGNVDAIVKGKVLSTQDVFEDNCPLRILTVKVQKAYKGDPEDQITVYENGALVPLKEVLPLLEGHYDPASLSQEDIEHGLVDYRFEGAEHSEAGDQVILYLCKNPNPSQAGSYQIVMSVYGRFKLDKGGNKYVRQEMRGNPSFETERPKEDMEATLDKLKSE